MEYNDEHDLYYRHFNLNKVLIVKKIIGKYAVILHDEHEVVLSREELEKNYHQIEGDSYAIN